MLKNHSEIFYPIEGRLHRYQIDDETIQYNDPVYRPLTVGVNGVTNTTEEKVNQSFAFSHNEKKDSTGWLKGLLIGTAALVGASTLMAGGYFYMTGRPSRAVLPYLADTRTTAGSSPIIIDRQITAASGRIPEESHSPYSYYENNQNVNSETIIKYNNYILDSSLKKELARFCLSSVYEFVIKSRQAEPNRKYELLSNIVDKIFYYKDIDSNLRQIYFGRESLSVEEKNNEVLIRRKLTTLYLAAETIISGKDTSHFYINAMKDDKDYSSEELTKREKNIMSYLSAHQSVGEY